MFRVLFDLLDIQCGYRFLYPFFLIFKRYVFHGAQRCGVTETPVVPGGHPGSATVAVLVVHFFSSQVDDQGVRRGTCRCG